MRALSIALQLGLQMPLLVFLSLWARYAGRSAPERAEGLALSLSFASLCAFVYVLNKTTDAVEDEENASLDPAVSRSARGLNEIAWLSLAAPIFWFVGRQQWAVLALYAFVGFWGYAYSRAIPSLGLKRRLKELFFLKNFAVAGFGWGPTIIYAPMALEGRLEPGHLLAYGRVAILVFAISTCWDIRDMRGDEAAGVRTLPLVLGVSLTKAIALLLTAAYAFTDPFGLASAGHRAATAATAAWIVLSGPGRGRGYYYWGLGFWIIELLWRLGRGT